MPGTQTLDTRTRGAEEPMSYICFTLTDVIINRSKKYNKVVCQVSVVFHSAATVKFDEKLKLSVTINMLGTQQLVQLCHRMLGLEVSCTHQHINKICYRRYKVVQSTKMCPSPSQPLKNIQLTPAQSHDTLRKCPGVVVLVCMFVTFSRHNC